MTPASEFLVPSSHAILNVSAFRLAYIYCLLSQTRRMSFASINQFLMTHPLVARGFSIETFETYAQTLRLFGCHLIRADEHQESLYHLVRHPLLVELSPESEKLFHKLAQQLAEHPVPGLYSAFCHVIHRIVQIDLPYPVLSALPASHPDSPLTIFNRYCQEEQWLAITLGKSPKTQKTLTVAPLEVVYERHRYYLVARTPEDGKKQRFDLAKIVDHKQLPRKFSDTPQSSRVTFELSGRLAKRYTPYPGETLEWQADRLQVVHVTDETDRLKERLLKYGRYCRVIAPQTLVDDMQVTIRQLLELNAL